VIEAFLDLWASEVAGKTRPLQSGYHAVWLLDASLDVPHLESGPIDVVGGRSLRPGDRGEILIHPMVPEAWLKVTVGAELGLISRSRTPRELGKAVVTARINVPAAAPLRLRPMNESGSRRRLSKP
jgi:hypothetical protein